MYIYFIYNVDRVGQNHIYTVYIRYFWLGNHQIYGHIRCIYTVLANPKRRICNTAYVTCQGTATTRMHLLRKKPSYDLITHMRKELSLYKCEAAIMLEMLASPRKCY
jgi:hypothetical protein